MRTQISPVSEGSGGSSSGGGGGGGGGVDDSASDMSASLEVSAEMYAALQEEHAALQTQMADTRHMLVSLQDLVRH